MLSYLSGIKHPEAFHGAKKKQGFFEGWYLKIVSADQAQRWAIIPGIFFGNKDNPTKSTAFVQVLNGTTGQTWFHEFEVNEFCASAKEFDVSIGKNHFDEKGIKINLPGLIGEIEFGSPLDTWPQTFSSPGIMGPYSFVPFMECNHGVVSFGHELSGELIVEDQKLDFLGGRGYIEKDWGSAFPKSYVWLHSNHFGNNADASFIGSTAIIPWLGRSFNGVIVALKHGGNLYKWATYNRSKQISLTINDDSVNWILSGPEGLIEITATREKGGLLHAPVRKEMHKRVEETMLAHFIIRHTDKNGKVLFEDFSDCSALEVHGEIETLLS